MQTSPSFLAPMPATTVRHSGEDDAVPIIRFPVPVAMCSVCLTLPVHSRKDSSAQDMPQQPTKNVFLLEARLAENKDLILVSTVAAWTRSNFLHLITKGMRWKWACETGAAGLIDLLHQNLSFQSFFLLPYFHFYLLQGSRSRLK